MINARHSISPNIFHHFVVYKQNGRTIWCCISLVFKLNEKTRTYRQYRKHHLRYIECMTPIMISNVTVIFLHTQQPPAQHFVFNVKPLNEIKFQKYSKARLKLFCECSSVQLRATYNIIKSLIPYPQRIIVVHINVVKCEVVQTKICGRWYFKHLKIKLQFIFNFFQSHSSHQDTNSQSFRIVHWCWGMITKDFQGNALFSHGNNRCFIHMRIVDAHTAENCESLHEILIIFGEILKNK